MEPFVGMLVQFAGNFAPRGWALCDGTLLSISQNQVLFSILGTTYGGDGVTTFALPDLRGRVCIHPGQSSGGSNYMLGQVGGAESVTLLVSNMPAHNHSYNAASTGEGERTATGAALAAPSAGIYTTKDPINATMNPAVIGMTGGSQPIGILQPYLAINWLIATEGVYPSRP
jgi:microcystin-dependent protein